MVATSGGIIGGGGDILFVYLHQIHVIRPTLECIILKVRYENFVIPELIIEKTSHGAKVQKYHKTHPALSFSFAQFINLLTTMYKIKPCFAHSLVHAAYPWHIGSRRTSL